ncbi:ABC transporter substrate-binding protein, partial [Methylobacterium radiotolerans]
QPQMLTGGGPGNATKPLVMYIWEQGFTFGDLGLSATTC